MATNCVKVLRGRVARLTRLDNCGRPMLGTCSTVVTNGVVEIKITPEIEAGDEIKVKTFDGQLCISDKACDQVKWWNTELTMCGVDPDLLSIVNPSFAPVKDSGNNTIGFMDNTHLACDVGFALEVWMQAQGTVNPCTQPPSTGITGQWWYYCLPWVIGGAPGDIDLKNDSVNFVYKGRTKVSSAWGVGPYPVLITTAGTPTSNPPGSDRQCGPLPMAVPASAQVIQFLTTLEPPKAVCGCISTTPAPAFAAVIPAPQSGTPLVVPAGTANNISGSTSPSAVIDWGDGTTSSVTLTAVSTAGSCMQNGPLPVYQGNSPTHTYKCAGVYTVTTTTGAGQVTTQQVTTAAALTVSGTGTKSSGIANLTVTNLKASTFTVDWKDGTVQTYQAVQDTNGCWQPATTGPQVPTHTYSPSPTGSTTTVTVSSGTSSADQNVTGTITWT